MKTLLYTFGLLALATLFGTDALAQGAVTVEPLTSIGLETGDQAGIAPFINQLYQYGVGIGAILAVLIVMYGGFRYMTSEAVGTKSAGKEDIQRAVLGLLLILSPVLIFGIINRDILSLDLNLNRLGDYERRAIDNGPGGGGLAASCANVRWNEGDSLFGEQKNIISPEHLRSDGLPTEMSTQELSRCCSFAGGSVKTNNRRIGNSNREYTETSCEYRDLTLRLRPIVHFVDETRISNATLFLQGEVKIGLCEEIRERSQTTWANNKINELYQDGILTFETSANFIDIDSIIEDESLITHFEISRGTVSCN